MLWLYLAGALAAAAAASFLIGYKRRWAAITNDFRIADEALARVEQLAAGWDNTPHRWPGYHRYHDRQQWLYNARRELAEAHRHMDEATAYLTIRAYLDDTLWWLAQCLIIEEPEYLQELYGEHRLLTRQLFWRWNGSMGWDGLLPNREQAVVRKSRLALYRHIQALAASKLVDESELAAARACLQRRDYPGETLNAQLDAERVHIENGRHRLEEGLRVATARKAQAAAGDKAAGISSARAQ